METRTFEAKDEAEVVALWHACGLTMPWNDPVADIRRCIDGPSSTLLVGLLNGAVAATAMAGHDGHRGWIYYVAVEPALQRSGLGRAIVAAAEAWLTSLAVPKVMLMVRESNDRVVPFYARLGYADEPRVVMSKWLARPSSSA